MISHVICSITWDNLSNQRNDSKWGYLEDMCMDNDLSVAVKDAINMLQTSRNLPNMQNRCYIFDPKTKERKPFCKGKVGIKEIPSRESQLISLHVSMAIYLDASGEFGHKDSFTASDMLAAIGNRITNEHIWALEGKLFTLAGIPEAWANAPLPIPLEYDFDEDEKIKLVPSIVTRKI